MKEKEPLRDSTAFYRSWFDSIKKIQDLDRLKLYDDIFEYCFYGTEPKFDDPNINCIFQLIKNYSDIAHDRFDKNIDLGKSNSGLYGKSRTLDYEKIYELYDFGFTASQIANQLDYNINSVRSVLKRKRKDDDGA